VIYSLFNILLLLYSFLLIAKLLVKRKKDLLTRFHPGPRVYERMFRRYCKSGMELCRYNVSEIVDRAMWLRQKMIEADGNGVKDYILHITDPRVPPNFDVEVDGDGGIDVDVDVDVDV